MALLIHVKLKLYMFLIIFISLLIKAVLRGTEMFSFSFNETESICFSSHSCTSNDLTEEHNFSLKVVFQFQSFTDLLVLLNCHKST